MSPTLQSTPPVPVLTAVSPLCVEEFDVQDRNFKPCPCGYQVCTRPFFSCAESAKHPPRF